MRILGVQIPGTYCIVCKRDFGYNQGGTHCRECMEKLLK